MGEQQQETVVAKSGSSSTILSIVIIVIVAGVIAWLGWGDEIKGSLAPAPTPVPAQATAPQAAAPVEPAKPRPTVAAPVSPKPLGAGKIGAFDLGGVYCLVTHYNQGWGSMDQQSNFAPEAGYPRTEGNTWEMKGKWSPSGADFSWHHTLQRVDPQTLDYDLSLKSETGVQTNALAMCIMLPITMYSGRQILIDGEPLILPADPATPATAALFGERTVNSVEIATPAGRFAFDGPIPVLVQDNRAYNPNDEAYLIRISLTPGRGLVTDAQLKMKIRQVLDAKASAAAAIRSEEKSEAK